ncbi:hypothetical protein FB107DRAFT_253785 [Schizophyllum commune]
MTSGSQQAYVSYDAYGQAWIYPYDCGSEGALELLPDAANFSSSSSYQGELHSPDSLAPSPMVMTPDGACYPPNIQYDAWPSNMCGETSIAPPCDCPNCVGVYIESDGLSTCATDSVPPDVASLYAAQAYSSASAAYGDDCVLSGPSYAQNSLACTSAGSIAPGMPEWTTAYCYSDSGSCGGVGIPPADATFSHQLPTWSAGLGASDPAEPGLAQFQATEDPFLLCPEGAADSPFDPYRGFDSPEDMNAPSGEISEEEVKYRRASQVIHPRPRRTIPIISLDKLAASSTESGTLESPHLARRTHLPASLPPDGPTATSAMHFYQTTDASDVYPTSCIPGMPCSHYCS